MNWVKNIIQGSIFESPSKWLYKKILQPGKSSWQLRANRDQQRLREAIPCLLKTDSNCIDVGAHKGAFLELFLKHAPNGSHLAFEPIPELYNELKMKYQNVEVHPLALSDHKGISKFHKVIEGLAWSGLELQEYPSAMSIEQININTNKLDEVLPEAFQPHFVKIDVEGAELKVLDGGKRTIDKYKPAILFEYALIHNKHYQTSPEQIFEFFKNCEMDIFRCDLAKRFQKQEFIDNYYTSYSSQYDQTAETNFIALNTHLNWHRKTF